MDGEEHGARVIRVFDGFELGGEIGKLEVRNAGPFLFLARLTGDHSRILERIGKQADDAHERGVEREIDSGLLHGGAVEGASLGGDDGLFGAKVALKDLQGFVGRFGSRRDEGIMVARDREDGQRIVSEGLVELVVIVLFLAKVINNVSQVPGEGRMVVQVGGSSVEGHLVGDGQLVLIFFAGRGSAGIAQNVKDNLSGAGDVLDHFGTTVAICGLQLDAFTVGHPRFGESGGLLT